MACGLRSCLILVGTAGVLGGCCFTGFGLWFAPGWANGWGPHRNVVWPAGLACVAFAAALVFAAGVWAADCAGEDPPRPAWPPSRGWALVGLGASAAVAVAAFLLLRFQAVAIWL